MRDRRIVVIGAGPGGLAAGMLLAHAGFAVDVCEQRPEVGGRTGRIQRGGYTWDTGSTLLMMRFILEELFSRTGRRASDYVQFVRLDPMYELHLGDDVLAVRRGPEAMAQELERSIPAEAPGYRRFMARERARLAKLFPCLRGAYPSLGSLLSRRVLAALPHVGLFDSMYDNAARSFDHELLRLAFSFQSAYLGMSPWECPGGFAMVPYVEHAYGVDYVMGGIHRVCFAMQRVIEECGGRVHTSAPVRRVVVERGVCKGVELADGTLLPADEVIVNADIAQAAHQLFDDGALGGLSRRKLAGMRYSCSTYMLYLGVERELPLPHHSFFFARSYRDEMARIFKQGTVGDDLSLYVCNPSATDGSVAPRGHSAIYLLALVPNLKVGPIDWEERRAHLRAQVLDLFARRTGAGELSPHIREEVEMTPVGWQEQLGVFHGATFSFSHVISQLLCFRPQHALPGLANAYMVGGGTSPGSGLPTILESARIAADLVCTKHGLATPAIATLPRPFVAAATEGRLALPHAA